jgi:hypothetical protein
MSPGPARIQALKEAGLLRQMAELARKIADRTDPSAGGAGIEQKRNGATPARRSKQDHRGQDDPED